MLTIKVKIGNLSKGVEVTKKNHVEVKLRTTITTPPKTKAKPKRTIKPNQPNTQLNRFASDPRSQERISGPKTQGQVYPLK